MSKNRSGTRKVFQGGALAGVGTDQLYGGGYRHQTPQKPAQLVEAVIRGFKNSDRVTSGVKDLSRRILTVWSNDSTPVRSRDFWIMHDSERALTSYVHAFALGSPALAYCSVVDSNNQPIATGDLFNPDRHSASLLAGVGLVEVLGGKEQFAAYEAQRLEEQSYAALYTRRRQWDW